MEQPEVFPFDINVQAPNGETIVHLELAHSTKQKTFAECMEAVGFDWNAKDPRFDRQCAIDVNTQRLADAEFIVRACNAHDELLAALKLYVAHFGDPLKVARGVIAKAEGR